VVIRDRDWCYGVDERKRVLDEIAELGWPVFVKPARGGSSVGITRVSGVADLEPAIEAARRHDPKVLVEAAVEGMEVECAVLEGIDGGPPEASLPGQVVVDPGSSFYDFQAKYLAEGTSMTIPAPIPAAAAAEVRRLACAAFEAISCEGLARVDFFYTPAGQVVFNEINTMPGMTPASGFPLMWAATGLPLPQLIDRIIQTALRKRPGPRLPAWFGRAGPVRLAGLRRLFLAGLVAVDEGLEVGTRAELRHRALGHLDGGPGGGVTGGASRTLALLEDAESGDGHLVADRDGRLDGLEHRVDGFGRGFLVPQPDRDRVDQITLVHVHSRSPPQVAWLRFADARRDL
jgi:hypothetical protein